MTDAYLGEVQIFGFNFAPEGWAFCTGQLMPLQQYSALFSLLGVTYGGNGTSNFALPNLQDQTVCAVGQGPGLTDRELGSQTGSMTVALQTNEIPSHNHGLNLFPQNNASERHASPLPGDALVVPPFPTFATGNPVASKGFSASLLPAGGGQPHPNDQPYLSLNFCIALGGAFPTRP
jgi:microcystin-dependent protein